jgi:hypothetical protein
MVNTIEECWALTTIPAKGTLITYVPARVNVYICHPLDGLMQIVLDKQNDVWFLMARRSIKNSFILIENGEWRELPTIAKAAEKRLQYLVTNLF